MKWNSTKTEYSQTCIHQLVEAVMERSPDEELVMFEQESVTYRQFSSRANNLSHYLQALGIGKEVLVGICMERSLEMVWDCWAFLRREERMCRLTQLTQLNDCPHVEDTQISVLQSSARLVKSLPQG
jgi:non-ribosomal peptide synthetase component E (peptide arylation enzyme)